MATNNVNDFDNGVEVEPPGKRRKLDFESYMKMGTFSLVAPPIDDSDDWAPPTDAELKIIAARRERQDKVSKLLGEYLLKGYKMMGTTCPACETILMRSKQGVDYCVACNELDSDITKDDPALNSDAARSQARERQLSYSQEDSTDSSLRRANGPSAYDETDRQPMFSSIGGGTSSVVQSPLSPTASGAAVTPGESTVQCASHVVANNALSAVCDQLASATDQLKKSSNIDTSKQICQLIKECADAALHLKQLMSHKNV